MFAALMLMFALGGSAGSKADDRLPQLRKGYEDCVFRSVRQQNAGGASEEIELAFQACQSEEQAIKEHLRGLGMAPATTDKSLQAFKLRLRKKVR